MLAEAEENFQSFLGKLFQAFWRNFPEKHSIALWSFIKLFKILEALQSFTELLWEIFMELLEYSYKASERWSTKIMEEAWQSSWKKVCKSHGRSFTKLLREAPWGASQILLEKLYKSLCKSFQNLFAKDFRSFLEQLTNVSVSSISKLLRKVFQCF